MLPLVLPLLALWPGHHPALAERRLPAVPDSSFEVILPETGFAAGWIRGVGAGTQGSAEIDSAVAHDGRHSLRISDATPNAAYKYVLVNSEWLSVSPETTYTARFWARGGAVGRCFVGVAFEGAGEHRQPVPTGTYEWQELTCRFTVPAGCTRVSLQFLADGVTEALWIDEVTLALSPVQLAGIQEARARPSYRGWFPRTPGPVPEHLAVVDVSGADPEENALMVALQGLVNRRGARLYLINPTNPPRYDELWLRYMRDQGYTGAEERLASPAAALERFRNEVRGVIVWDPELPGSIHAAWMLAGLRDALPAAPGSAARLGLPIVEDLRGRWRRNVEAYRYVYERHWAEMNHRLLAWEYPGSNALSSRDLMVQQKVFMFWVSSYTDGEKGADPPAEMEFVEELLSKTPGNVPVMGWPMYGTRGIEEYTGVRLLSEYGKWVPGTSFNSNVSVHSAIRPPAEVFRQHSRQPPPPPLPLDPGKVYLSVSILDSGDAQWYWQLYQRTIWADPARGSVPTGYGMNMTLLDSLPLVAQWYYEQMTPNDSFFGLLYMNAPVYASRFRDRDRERIWREFVRQTGKYLQALDMDGLELYTGGTGGAAASADLLRRFTGHLGGLRYLLAGLGRHAGVKPAAAAAILDDTVVLQTLTDFRVWSLGADLSQRQMADENAWLLGEIAANTPTERPGFMSAMAISWMYSPAWLKDLKEKLPPQYVLVSPAELARLYRESRR